MRSGARSGVGVRIAGGGKGAPRRGEREEGCSELGM